MPNLLFHHRMGALFDIILWLIFEPSRRLNSAQFPGRFLSGGCYCRILKVLIGPINLQTLISPYAGIQARSLENLNPYVTSSYKLHFLEESMSKRFIILLSLLVAVAIVATACGGAAQPAAPASEKPAATEQPAEAPKATEAPATEAAAATEAPKTEAAAASGCDDALGCVTVADGDPIVVASALSISGATESLGLDSQYGVEVAIKERGEIAGHSVELLTEDDGCSAEGGQTAATKLASDTNVVAVIGHTCSSSCTPAAPIYNDAGVTMISPSCTAPALTGAETHVPSFLRTAPNDKLQGRVVAEFAYNKLGVRKAATIHDGSPYAEQLQQVFADRFKELGGEITAQEAVNVGDTDMRPVLTSIATGKPEFLYYPIFIAEGGFVTTQAKEVAGLEKVILAGSDGLISPDFIKVAGTAAEGMYVSGPDLSFGGEKYDNFKKAFAEVAGQEPFSAFHAHAYDATNIVLNAIEKVAKKDADGNLVIGRQAFRDAMYSTKDYAAITGNLTCNKDGDCADPKIGINQVTKGEYVPVPDALK